MNYLISIILFMMMSPSHADELPGEEWKPRKRYNQPAPDEKSSLICEHGFPRNIEKQSVVYCNLIDSNKRQNDILKVDSFKIEVSGSQQVKTEASGCVNPRDCHWKIRFENVGLNPNLSEKISKSYINIKITTNNKKSFKYKTKVIVMPIKSPDLGGGYREFKIDDISVYVGDFASSCVNTCLAFEKKASQYQVSKNLCDRIKILSPLSKHEDESSNRIISSSNSETLACGASLTDMTHYTYSYNNRQVSSEDYRDHLRRFCLCI